MPPLRLGFFTHLIGTDARRTYQETLELAEAADALGYDVFWVAQHHLQADAGLLPAPLPFLAVVAERARRIRIGTAVVTISFEHPLGLAEEAAVVDVLSGGRLELGVGSGSEPDAFSAFGVDAATARDDTTARLDQLQRLLRGEPAGDTGSRLQPRAEGLDQRLWRGTSSLEGARQLAQRDVGLLVPRVAVGGSGPTGQVQAGLIEAYLDSRAGRPGAARVGVSRTVYPAADRATARAHLRAGVLHQAEVMQQRGRLPAGLSEEEYFRRSNVIYGHPEDVVAVLRADAALRHASDLIVQFDPGRVRHDQALAALERVAVGVAPALGWQPGPAAAGPVPVRSAAVSSWG
jgi:alkanesulfonate monooxygenase SsuD/methylene tetrahydromethanopterin reductase-like flavin-dependent oxidoreductase (luciferase family)